MYQTLMLALALTLVGCADSCPDSEKLAVTKIEACTEDTGAEPPTCSVTLSNGKRTLLLSPKIGEMVCP